MAAKKACFPKRYATDARDPVTGLRITVYVFSCIPCGIYGKKFKSKNRRDAEYDLHK